MKQLGKLFFMLFGIAIVLGSALSVFVGLFYMILAPGMAPGLQEDNIKFGRLLTGVGVFAFLVVLFVGFKWRKKQHTGNPPQTPRI